MTSRLPARKNERRARFQILLVFAVLAVAILTTGYLYYQNYEKEYRTGVEHQLSAVAGMEVTKIVQWKSDRLNDPGVFFHNPLFSSRVQHLFNDSSDAESQGEVRTWLEKEQANSPYDRVYLLDTTGALRMSTPGTKTTVATSVSEQVNRTLQLDQVTLIDFYRDDQDQKIYLAVLVPVFDDEEDGKPLGVLVFQIDPGQDLYPFISQWPAPSDSAETQLVRPEGNDVVYLNAPEVNPGAALALRVPLNRTNVPAVQAVLGGEGIVDGVDYQGVPVIADIQKVPNTPWFLVTRMDNSEIYGPLRERALLLILIIILLLAGAGAGIGLIWRDQNIRFDKEMYEVENVVLKERLRAQSYLDIVGTTVISVDARQVVTMVNRAGCRLLGRDEIEIIGKNWFDTFLPERDRDEAKTSFAQVIDGSMDQAEKVENTIVTAGGMERLVAWHITLIRGEDQAITGTLCSGEDITDRRLAEEALRENEEKYRHVIEYSNEAIVVAQDGLLKLANRRAVELTGYMEQELLSMSFLVFIHPDDRAMVAERYEKRMKGLEFPSRYSFRIRSKDGITRWVEISTIVIDWEGRPATLNFLTDITGRKQAEDARKDSEQRLSEIISFLPDATFAIDRNGCVISWNYAMEEMTGVLSGQILGKGNYEYALPLYGTRRPLLIDTVFSPGMNVSGDYSFIDVTGDVLTAETVSASPRGKKVILGVKVAPLYDWEGTITGAIESIRDITDRRQAEEALAESEERYRSLYVDSRDAVMILSPERGFLAANPATVQLFGSRNEQDFINHTPASLSPEYQPDGLLSNLKSREMMSIAMEKGSHFFEWTHRRTNGTDFPTTVLLSRLENQGMPLLQATVRDITERRRAEEAIRQANKKLTLLSGITRHDINNQLTVLMGYLELLKMKQPDPSFSMYFNKITNAAERILAMIQFTKIYEGIGVDAPVWQNIRTPLNMAVKDVTLGDIRLVNDIPADLTVFADQLIIKVFFNLMDNAVRYGGKITTIRFSVEERDGNFVIVCSDDGNGVSVEEKEKIFERGFGKNTGLGLFLSREILSLTGIKIKETGEPGKGARFEMMVPNGAWRTNLDTSGGV